MEVGQLALGKNDTPLGEGIVNNQARGVAAWKEIKVDAWVSYTTEIPHFDTENVS